MFSGLKTETNYKVYLSIEANEIPGAFNTQTSSVMYNTPKKFGNQL